MNKFIFPFAIATVALCITSVHAAPPVVTNLAAAQRANSRLVDIHYDVSAGVSTVTVSLEISPDDGTTWSIHPVTLTGDIGAGVHTGTGKTITWNAGVDWNEQVTTQMKFRVTADDLVLVPSAFVLIPAGAFTMGDALDASEEMMQDATPTRQVTVSAFYICENVGTKAEWDDVRA